MAWVSVMAVPFGLRLCSRASCLCQRGRQVPWAYLGVPRHHPDCLQFMPIQGSPWAAPPDPGLPWGVESWPWA